MGVVRFGIDKILPDRHTAVFVGCGIVQQSRTYGTTVMPQSPARSRVQRKHIIRGSHVHDAANHHWSSFQPLRIARVKNPGRAQSADVCLVNFTQAAKAASGVVSVIRGPTLAYGTR